MCLPSYREGFGTVVIEAAAMRLTTLGSDIYGLTDAIINGETGLLVPPRDSLALANEMMRLLCSPALIKKMSDAAYERCLEHFDSEVVNALLIEEYNKFLN
jgi:glycosyltransferase involved in cell wall biosynthesis